MNSLLRKPKDKITKVEGKYTKYNLSENPFPITPVVNKENDDKRYNGEIYEPSIRQDERKQLTNNFLKIPQSNPNHLRLGYILDDSYVGRGNGKSAFILDMLKRINHNYCLDISEETNKCFGIYISPAPSGRTKTFYNFIDALFNAILRSNIIKYSLASLRLEGILELNPNFDIEASFHEENDIIECLNNVSWFEKQKIHTGNVSRAIFKNDFLISLSPNFPLFRDKKSFYNPLLTTQNDFKNYFEGLKKGDEKLNFIFNDLVNFFLASGFNGSYIFVDDFERIPDFQSDRQKRDFALELRTNLFDGTTQNAKVGFFNFMLILHAGVPRLISKSWSDTGLERRSPLTAENYNNSRHVILFNKLTHDHAILLVKKYLHEYRVNQNSEDDLFPFTKEAIQLISEKAELNAASILEKAHNLMEKAIEEDITEINRDFVATILGVEQSNDDYEFDDDFAKEDTVNLFDKAK